MKRLTLILLACIGTMCMAQAQRSCGTMNVLQQQQAADPTLKARMQQIENFTRTFVANGGGHSRSIINIPVVVHVVYNTTAQNISDAQVQSQIDILNKDYQALNSDISGVPSMFSGLVGNYQIQFCLAQRTPAGAATNGIERTSTTKTSFSDNDGVKKTSTGGAAAWSSSSYLNLWVCNLSGGLLGYAQFPGGAAATDGVVINYTAFGNIGTAAAPYNLGRSATHEIGHWLNLYHIWGDDNGACTGTDNVDDTPNQASENYGCPTFPHASCSNTSDMFMNYMDYTDDACMFMFSAGQKARSMALFATGGARASLLTSLGCTAPATAACGTPTSLAAGSITSSGAALSWAAVSGATSYTVGYKLSTASTYTNVTVTTNTYALSGLAAASTYNYQVTATCSGGTSAAASSTFTTSATTVTCGTPTGLAAGSITTSSAALSWTAVSGATSYTLGYKLISASTYINVTVTTNSYALSGLAASSTYNYQVTATCASGTSAIASSTFTTAAVVGTCSENNEPNGSTSAATMISAGTLTSQISTSTDNDYYKITNSSAARNIKVTLTTLPLDYDLRLYNASGTLLYTSQNGSTTSEAITYNNAPVGTYYIRVYGYNGKYSTTACYTLTTNISSTSLREEAPITTPKEDDAPGESLGVINYPNPTTGLVYFDLSHLNTSAKTNLSVFDLTGKEVFNQELQPQDTRMTAEADLSTLGNGVYFAIVQNGEQRETRKIIISK